MFDYLKNNKFLKENFILLILNFLGAGFTFFFHFYVGRTLGPTKYSIIGSILSFVYILSILFYTIQIVITRHVAQLKKEHAFNKLSFMIKKLLKIFIIFSFIITLFIFLLSPYITDFLNLDSIVYVQLISVIVLGTLLLPLMRGIFQGLQKFNSLGITYALEGFLRLTLCIILFSLGGGVLGIIIAIILSYILPALCSLVSLKKILKHKIEKYSFKNLYKFAFPVLIAISGMSLIYTIDVLLVKHFFSALKSGQYIAISNLGKIIYFSSITVGFVLLPKITENLNSSKIKKKILLKSLILVFLISFPFIISYFLFPKFIIFILYGKDYLNIAHLLGKFSIFITLFSMSYLLIYYQLAQKRFFSLIFLFLFLIFEIFSIWFFHKNLEQIINILLIGCSYFFVSLLFIFFKKAKKI